MLNDPALARRIRRDAVVREHVAAENAGDLDPVLASFRRPRYEVIPMGADFEGADLVDEKVFFDFAPVQRQLTT